LKRRFAQRGTDQLARNEEVGKVRLGVVVPVEGRAAALRVQPRVRQLLSIDVFVVDESGTIELVRE